MISEIMERHIKSICSEYGTYIVNKLSVKYGFDAEAEIRELELPSIKIAEAAPRRKDVTEKKPKAAKVEKAPVPSIPLPFCGKAVEGWCSAIVKNNKLYTQCTNTATGLLCKKCTKISEKEGSLPFGIISSRLECEPMSYKDPKGNAPVLYSAVMAKLNITREEAEAEAAKFGLTIPEEQFAVVEKARGRPKKEIAEKSDDEKGEKKARGRPKKDKPVKASSKAGDDIIAGLLMEAKDNETDDDAAASDSQSSNEAELVSGAKAAVEKVMKEVADKKQAKEKKPKQTDEEKAAAKAAKEAEKAAAKEAEKAAKAAAKEAEKAAKEAEKAAAKAAKEAEKTAKAKVEKPKAAKAVAEKPEPVAAAAAAPPAAAAKPLKGGVGVPESKGNDDASSSSCEEESYDEESEEEEAVTVKKFEHAGKKYKISTKDNILYDWDDDEPVGVWNPKTKTIDELPEEDSEEEDDE